MTGCSMAGPGVAQVQPQGSFQEDMDNGSVYNDDWTNGPQATSVDSLDANAELSADISERELGVRYLDEDTRVGDKYEPAHRKRQRERQEARRAVWRERMGITTIKDEQDAQDE